MMKRRLRRIIRVRQLAQPRMREMDIGEAIVTFVHAFEARSILPSAEGAMTLP